MSYPFLPSIGAENDEADFVRGEIVDPIEGATAAIAGEEDRSIVTATGAVAVSDVGDAIIESSSEATLDLARGKMSDNSNDVSSAGGDDLKQLQYWMPTQEQLTPEASMLRYLMAVALPQQPIQDWEGLLQAISETLVRRLLKERPSYVEEVLAMYWPPEFLEVFEALEPAIRYPTADLDLLPPAEASQIMQAWAASLTLYSPAFRARLQRNATLSFPLEVPIDPIAEEAQWAVEELSLDEWLPMLLMST